MGVFQTTAAYSLATSPTTHAPPSTVGARSHGRI